MIFQNNSFIWFKFNAASRLALIHCFSGFFPLYIINEYPKSGGTWLGQMLADAMDVPFPRNRLPILRSSILHGHYLWSGFMKNVVIIWRDGRDVLISQYYHSLFKNEKGNARLVDITRNKLKFSDYNDIRNNLVDFIEYTYINKKHPNFSWADFANVWAERQDAAHVRYEDLRQNPGSELKRVVKIISNKDIDLSSAQQIAEKYSFEKQSGRKPGQENTGSFMRKGIIGDWKNHFTPEAKRLFDKYAGDALIKLGYEKDHSWADSQQVGCL